MYISADNLYHLCKNDGGIFRINTLEEAYVFCERIAKGHYENFPVGSALIPKQFRKYFYSVYAFSRIADDISDEIDNNDKELKLQLLQDFKGLIKSPNIDGNPIFTALQDTMKKREIPSTPFEKLITAFEMDSDFSHPEDWNDILNYCSFSANPVGELVLRIFNQYNAKTAELSDNICTGLQLANFWQDISIDSEKGRIYIPKNILEKYGISTDEILNKKVNSNISLCLKEIYEYTDKFFILGNQIITNLKFFRLKLEISAVIEGGKAIMNKTRGMENDIIRTRPKLNKTDFTLILIKAFKNIF